MSTESDYIAINRQSWNNRVASHLTSDFYDVEGFIKGKTSLNSIELDLLGDIKGKSILHLQCHFGQDTISLERMGAIVTGVDLSDKAIESANELAEKTGSKAQFICCDIYDLPLHLETKFDIVFTTYGTIGWLPDLDRWAGLIARYLKPGGQLVFVEFHPVVWMFDNHFEKIIYNYFKASAIIETETGTYADRDAPIQVDSVTWNHSISEVVNSLIKYGLNITTLNEYDYSPYNCFKGTVEFEPHKFRIESMGNKLPMVYAVVSSTSSE
ncbi:MAG: class I SAM-dependent methyltransferase [Bacteroidota bacterium]